MVEYKASIYDESEPQLVPATLLAPNEASALLPQEGPNDTGETPPLHSGVPSTRNSNDDPHNKMVASGTAGAVIGFFMGGPLIAALLGFGTAYATKKTGAPGDAARALGDVAISTREKAKALDEKHHIVDRSKETASKAWEQAKEYDRRHNVLDATKDAVVSSWGAFVKFVKEHRLLERGVDGVGRGYEYVAERVSSESTDDAAANDDVNRPQQATTNATQESKQT